MTVRELLFPTDFSAASERAAQVAAEMARHWGARLHVLHVVPPPADAAGAAVRLGALAAALGPGLRVERAVRSGFPARQIAAYARDQKVDMIVLGTHGRTGVSRAILGSVAESVVRTAPCPVLTVPPAVLAPAEPRGAAEAAIARRCVVCGGETEELICEPCRARIRGEALERKIEAERPGRRGSPA